MKRIMSLIIASLMIGVICAQKTATFTSQECDISFTYDTEIFYKVTPQARNTIFKIESSEYMTFMTINVQRNVERIDFSDGTTLQQMNEMLKGIPFVSKILQPARTYRYGNKVGAKIVTLITGKNPMDMVDVNYYFYHKNNLVTITFETLDWYYNETPGYCEQFIKGLRLF